MCATYRLVVADVCGYVDVYVCISRERQTYARKLKLWKLRERSEEFREQVKNMSGECEESGECVNSGWNQMQRVLVGAIEKTIGHTSDKE